MFSKPIFGNCQTMALFALIIALELGLFAFAANEGRAHFALSFTNNGRADGSAPSHALLASRDSLIAQNFKTQSITVQAWVMPSSMPPAVASKIGLVAGNLVHSPHVPLHGGYGLFCRNVANLSAVVECGFVIGTSSTSFELISAQLPTVGSASEGTAGDRNGWYHISGSFDSVTKAIALHVDGRLVNSTQASSTSSISYANHADLTVGGWLESSNGGGATNSNSFEGMIDEVKIWSSARTTPQILGDAFDTIDGQASTSGLLSSFGFNEGFGSAVTDVAGSIEAQLRGSPTPQFIQIVVDVNNSSSPIYYTSYIDSRPTVRVTVTGQGSWDERRDNGAGVFQFEYGKSTEIVIEAEDLNPTDTIQVGTPATFPVAGGAPGGIVLGSQGAPIGAYTTIELRGVTVRRTLSWTPSFESEWLIPAGGLPVQWPISQVAANPSKPTAALPSAIILSKPFFWNMSVLPEFMQPGGFSNFSLENAYIGEGLSFDVKVRERNTDQSVSLTVDSDPGLPNFAEMSAVMGSGIDGEPLSRTFTWTPVCEQVGNASVVFRAKSSIGEHSTKRVTIRVLQPSPVIESPRFGSFGVRRAVPGCQFNLSVVARESNLDCVGKEAYKPAISIDVDGVSDFARSGGMRQSFSQGANESVVASFTWTPARLDSGSSRTVCFRLKTTCGVLIRSVCAEVRVAKCSVCLRAGQSLSDVAAEYGTSANSIWAANPDISKPGMISQGIEVKLGGIVKANRENLGNWAAVSRRFLVPLDVLARANPDLNVSHENADESNSSVAVGTQVCVPANLCGMTCVHEVGCTLKPM